MIRYWPVRLYWLLCSARPVLVTLASCTNQICDHVCMNACCIRGPKWHYLQNEQQNFSEGVSRSKLMGAKLCSGLHQSETSAETDKANGGSDLSAENGCRMVWNIKFSWSSFLPTWGYFFLSENRGTPGPRSWWYSHNPHINIAISRAKTGCSA